MSKYLITVTSADVPQEIREIFRDYGVGDSTPLMAKLGTEFEEPFHVDLIDLEEECGLAYNNLGTRSHDILNKAFDGWVCAKQSEIQEAETLADWLKETSMTKETVLRVVENFYKEK